MVGFLKKDSDFKITQNISDNGIEFSIKFVSKNHSETVTFPIQFSKYLSLKELVKKEYFLRLQALDELWTSNYLMDLENGWYLLPKDRLYDIDRDLLDIIGIKDGKDLKIKLYPHMMVGSKDFSIKYDIFHPELGYISRYARINSPLISVDNEHLFLLSEDSAALIDTLEAGVPAGREQIWYVARVQELARNCSAELDSYLENEKYYFPKNLDINISGETPDQLELKPVLVDLPEEFTPDEDAIVEAGYGYKSTVDGKRHRVIIEPPIKDKYKFIKEKGILKGSEVPRFIENPFQYEDLLPESFDLEKFSERVKGLKARVYKAAPFVRTKESGYNWFDIEVGGVIRNAFDDEDEFEVDAKEYINLIEEARKSGKEYVKFNDKWIKIPEDNDSFIDAYEKFNKTKETRVNERKSLISFIFDIFDNVDELEYSLDLLQEKSNLQRLKTDWEKGLLKIKATLYPHQEVGYRWLAHLNYCGLGGLLADDMGLGKTIQVIALMIFLEEKNLLKPSLIIAPKSILDNWRSEINRFSDIKNIYIHRGNYRIKDPAILKEYPIVLTTYDTLVRDQLIFGEIDWQIMICDEAQRIKNHSTYSSHAVKALKAKMRLALTGTPVENRLVPCNIYNFG